MLKTICDGCGKVMDERVEGEYFDAMLVIEGEVALEFEDLCDECKSRLRKGLRSLLAKPAPKPAERPEPTQKREAPRADEHAEPAKQAEAAETVERELPNQVTKQYPVKLNLPHHHEG